VIIGPWTLDTLHNTSGGLQLKLIIRYSMYYPMEWMKINDFYNLTIVLTLFIRPLAIILLARNYMAKRTIYHS